jgi:hypothetical protein
MMNVNNHTVNDSSIIISPSFRVVDETTIFVSFDIINHADETRIVSLSVAADICLGGIEGPHLTPFGHESGLLMETSGYTFSFVGRWAPTVTDIDSFWFGHFLERHSHLWDQAHGSLLDGTDSGMTFAWRNRVVRPHSTHSLLTQFAFGSAWSMPILQLTTELPPVVNWPGNITVMGRVFDLTLDVFLRVNLMIDWSIVVSLASDMKSGADFAALITLGDHGIKPGYHDIHVFATNSYGLSCDEIALGGLLLNSIVTEIHLDTNYGTYTVSHTNPVVIYGVGALHGPQDGEFSFVTTNVTDGAIVYTNQLVLLSKLFMFGASAIKPLDGDGQIWISDELEITLFGDSKRVPSLDLGTVGKYFSGSPKKLSVFLNGITDGDIATFEKPLVVAQTLWACEAWTDVAVVEPSFFDFVCKPGSNGIVGKDEKRTLLLMGRKGEIKTEYVLILAIVLSIAVIILAGIVVICIKRRRRNKDIRLFSINEQEYDSTPGPIMGY